MGHMPKQKPGRSRQCYVTPSVFIDAIETRFSRIDFDLAATSKNAKADRFFTKRQNALDRKWINSPSDARLHFWLNPPYQRLCLWFAAVVYERLFLTTGSITVLVPASVGTNWFRKYVFNNSRVYFLDGRIAFMHDDPYPKDLMIVRFHRKIGSSISIWDWKKDKLYKQR